MDLRPVDLNPYRLWVEFLFGLIGTGYILYGKKQGHFLALGCGLALAVFPYFIGSFVALAIVGLLLAALPFVLRG